MGKSDTLYGPFGNTAFLTIFFSFGEPTLAVPRVKVSVAQEENFYTSTSYTLLPSAQHKGNSRFPHGL
jgi:hypothetical protein